MFKVDRGKKGKKNKGKVVSLQSFLSNGNETPLGTTQVAKKVRNYDGESDDDSGALPVVFQLPTAPRANRLFDDDSIPNKPPFIAYVTNLPFDANEDDIYAFFGAINIVSLRLPRDDGDTGRVRGFGYVELESRDDLIHVLSMPDPSIKGRRIRIDLSNENEQRSDRQRNNRRGYDGFGGSGENRDSTNWRRDNNFSQESSNDRGFNRQPRERRDNSQETGAPGSWRTGGRPAAGDSSPYRSGFRDGGNRDRDRDRGGDRQRDYDRDGDRGRSFAHAGHDNAEQERPKLNLKPRTLPLPEIVQQKPEEKEKSRDPSPAEEAEKPVKRETKATAAAVFGAAKPVDTAKRELEIEERLAQSRQEALKKQEQERDTEVTNKMDDVHLDKPEKDNANATISWRNRDSNDTDSRGSMRKTNGERWRDNRDVQRDSKNLERNERNRDKQNVSRDNKTVENKPKREPRTDRPMPKLIDAPAAPIAQISNKYEGLEDEASE